MRSTPARTWHAGVIDAHAEVSIFFPRISMHRIAYSLTACCLISDYREAFSIGLMEIRTPSTSGVTIMLVRRAREHGHPLPADVLPGRLGNYRG